MAWSCSNCWPAMVSSTRVAKLGKAKSGGGGGMLSMVSAWWGKRVDGAKGVRSSGEQQGVQQLGSSDVVGLAWPSLGLVASLYYY